MINNRELLVAHLKGLADGSIRPLWEHSGLCSELDRYTIRKWIDCPTKARIRELMVAWPQGTGSTQYPVPFMLGARCSEARAQRTYCTRTLPWGNNAYGRARRAMCLWIAQQLEKEGSA